ncbi:MAG: hypothetical protein IKI58_08510, partial [Oscillospiraceae bacterium]|nr:hypothetical protein [Oscillospiraceae bacterium]
FLPLPRLPLLEDLRADPSVRARLPAGMKAVYSFSFQFPHLSDFPQIGAAQPPIAEGETVSICIKPFYFMISL